MGVGKFLEEISVKDFGSEFGIEEAWTDSVNGDAVIGEFAGGSTSKINHGAFAGVIGDGWDFGITNEAIDRSDIDNTAVFLLFHNVAKGTGHLEY